MMKVIMSGEKEEATPVRVRKTELSSNILFRPNRSDRRPQTREPRATMTM